MGISKEIIPIERVAGAIHLLRGQRVMLDFDLAALYGVATKVLNQAVKRNAARFPDDFMFQLSRDEVERISQIVAPLPYVLGSRSQFVTLNPQIARKGRRKKNWSQIVTSSLKHRGMTYRPYAFTEQGVAMLSSVLNSELARLL